MGFCQITKIKFEAEVKTLPQTIISEFDFKAPKCIKMAELIPKRMVKQYTLQKIGEKLYELTTEQLDLFGIYLGEWTENDSPERENIIKKVVDEIKSEQNHNRNI